MDKLEVDDDDKVVELVDKKAYDSVCSMTTSPAQLRRVALSALLGTTIEFYDFLLYGTMAALVFNKLFFPSASPVAGTMAAFGTMAAGYITRPLGGVVLGHFGDRFGRKSVLTWTMVTMGIASFLIGILPTYRTIGIWAPIFLVTLRLVQGVAAGGEWGGSALMVVEHADSRRRGFWSSSVQVGASAGSLVSKIAISLVVLLPSEQLLAWGWRIPFLVSILLCGVGLFVRLAIAESPLFEEAQSEKTTVRSPLRTVLRRPRAPVLACGAGLATFVVLAFGHIYGVAYALRLGYDESTIIWTVTASALLVLLATPVFAVLSDHVGRTPVIAIAAGAGMFLAYPILWLIDGSTSGLVVGMMLAALLQAATYGPLAALLTEMFGTNVRYTGASIGYQVAAMLGGGFTPLIATELQSLGGGSAWVSAFLATCFAITLASVLLIGETSRRGLSGGQQPRTRRVIRTPGPVGAGRNPSTRLRRAAEERRELRFRMSTHQAITGCFAWVPVLIRRTHAKMGGTEWGF
ncbi:MAG TPA: MFS transporter [Mycobacterium sp.]|nr:MFS transporter [Mycobacterium sp.]